MRHILAFLAALALAACITACGVRSAVTAVVPPLPPVPTATPANAGQVDSLTSERDDLRARLAIVDSRLKSADEEAHKRQLDAIATWLTWIGILAILAGIVLGVIGYGLRGIGITVGSCGIGVLSFARWLAEYGHLLKYGGALLAVGLVAWVAWTHRKTATKAATTAAVADAGLRAVEELKKYADDVIGPDKRSALLSNLTSEWSQWIDARRVDLGLKKGPP